MAGKIRRIIRNTRQLITNRARVIEFKGDNILPNKAKATVYWESNEDWREWGLNEIQPKVVKVVVYTNNGDGTTTTREFTENIEVDYSDSIPFMAESVKIYKPKGSQKFKVTVYFGRCD